MTWRISSVAFAAVMVLGACTTADDDADGTAGTGGTGATGGGAGTSATGGGGSSGSSGEAGTAGSGGNTAGAAGSTGGAAGSTGGAAGSTGGAAGATGGTGGGTATPRCDDLCQSFVDVDCAEGPTLAGCLLTCKALTSSAACDDKANAYFDCTESTTFECNAQGDPVAKGCGLDYLAAVGCAVTENPNPAIVTPCSDYCDDIAAAACPNNGTLEECNTNCLWLGATGTGCDDEWSTYLTCANTATFSCLLGYAIAQGCGTDWQAYKACIDTAGGT